MEKAINSEQFGKDDRLSYAIAALNDENSEENKKRKAELFEELKKIRENDIKTESLNRNKKIEELQKELEGFG